MRIADFNVKCKGALCGASGEGYGALVTVDRLDLGDIELRNVGAVVVRDLGVSLLGQSVLARFGKLELEGDRMVLVSR